MGVINRNDRLRASALVGAFTLAGCGDDGGSDPFGTNSEGSASTTGPTSTTSSSTSGATDSGSATDTTSTSGDPTATDTASGTGDIKFDIGAGPDVPGGNCDPDEPDCGCTAVDILFVVDNSGSMQTHAGAVTAAFDTFVEEMVTALPPSTSLHVGVTRGTGFYDPGNSGGFNGTTCEGQTDGAWNPPTVSENGINGHQGRLYEQDGQNYFELETGQNAVPLKTWFQAALTGAINPFVNYSNSETVVAGASYAFHPINDTHNAGFMREQAVLVIFLLSDSPDLSPANVPTSDFVDMVSDAKAACGDMCILTTGAIAGGCYDTAGITNTRLFDWMNGFGQAPASMVEFQGQNSPDFTGVLGTTLSEVIKTTCDQIPPVG